MIDFTKLQDEANLDAARRTFLRSTGLAAAGMAIIGAGAGVVSSEAEAAAPTDADILNFALNLEYLEAEFYLRAANGVGLSSGDVTGTGTPGAVTGGSKVPFTSATIAGYAQEIAGDELAHVRFLRGALGAGKVARPKINLSTSFTAAAVAAGVITAGQTFNPFANQSNFLLGSFIFEDVGVTAYKGAARFITNKDYLEAAAGILAVEAYHAGEIRTLLYAAGLFDPANKISAARGALSGNASTDQGIQVGGKPNIIPALPVTGIVPSRTTRQVLNIVYLNGSNTAASGGFFPSGLNGTIKS